MQSLRWFIPLVRLRRLYNVDLSGSEISRVLDAEKLTCLRRLTDQCNMVDTAARVQLRWADLLYQSVHGMTFRESAKVSQQHRWISDGTKFLSGRDFKNSVELRINALLTRSMSGRGRYTDRNCRAGCQAVETQRLSGDGRATPLNSGWPVKARYYRNKG